MYVYNRDSHISADENISVEEYCDRTESYLPHTHEFIEFVYIKSGSAMHTVGDKEFHLFHGDMLIIDYGQVHSFTPAPVVDYVNILLDPTFFSKELVDAESINQLLMYDMFEEFFGMEAKSKQCIHFGKKFRNDVDYVIEKMLSEFKDKNLGYRSVLKGYMRILLSWILRETNFKENDAVLDEVIAYINNNISEKIDLQELAAKHFYNPSYFSRLIKEKFGKNFSSYIKEKRILTAKEMLENSQDKVEKIMGKIGYTDKKLFYKHFKEYLGMTPGEYRKTMKNDC